MNIPDILRFVAYSSGIFLQLFWPTFFGNEISKKSEQFVGDLYNSDWTNADMKSRRLLITLMETMKQPIIITVIHVYKVDLDTFRFVSLLLNFRSTDNAMSTFARDKISLFDRSSTRLIH